MRFFYLICNKIAKYSITTILLTNIATSDAVASVECTDLDSQTSINTCLIEKVKQHTLLLEKTYQQLHVKSNDQNKQRLSDAREAWKKFSDNQCRHNISASEGGSAHSMLLSLCYIEFTDHYITLLKEQLNCIEGDLSCTNGMQD